LPGSKTFIAHSVKRRFKTTLTLQRRAGDDDPGGINVSGQHLNLPWSGADNTNHFFTHQELFDANKTEIGVTPPGFVERLLQAGTNVSTYDATRFTGCSRNSARFHTGIGQDEFELRQS